MKVRQLMDALRRLDPDHDIVVLTHVDMREVKFVEAGEHSAAVIDIRFSERVTDEPADHCDY